MPGLAPGPTPVVWSFFADPDDFLREAAPVLARDATAAAIVTANARRVADSIAAGDPAPAYPRWFAAARRGGEQVAAAMRTAWFVPHPPWLLPMSDDAALALAEVLVARGEVVGGANGAVPAARVFAHRVAELTGGAVEVLLHLRQWELRDVTPSAARDAVPGSARPAAPADRETLVRWWLAFADDAELQSGRTPSGRGADGAQERATVNVERKAADGTLWVWEADGEVVSMAGASAPGFGVVNLSPVYTPGHHRGRGYAGALVAALAADRLANGLRVCLFTDQANPVSNGVYARIGFEPIGDNIELVIRPADPKDRPDAP